MAATGGAAGRAAALRRPSDASRVTTIELFFDLVFVFAVTQLSDRLLTHRTPSGAGGTALLLAMVWLLWVYTTWVTNWLDPDRLPVRGMLLAAALVSLVLSAAVPEAFAGRGAEVGGAYAVLQVGRTAFAVAALRGDRLQRNFERILCWCVLSAALALAGGLVRGPGRVGLWLAAVVVDLLGGLAGFAVPGLGRSTTSDWDVSGDHFAERCQAFLLIALGESVVAIGATLSDLPAFDPAVVAACAAAFGGVAALWWVYFDRSAELGSQAMAEAEDPGRLARSAYHLIHPVMIAGIIATAAADHIVLAHPSARADTSETLLVLGGTGLFLVGHALFKAVVWRVLPATRLAAVGALALVAVIVADIPAWALGAITTAVVAAVAVADRSPGSPWAVAPGKTDRA